MDLILKDDEVKKRLPHLFSKKEAPPLKVLLATHSDLVPKEFSHTLEIVLKKDSLNPNEEKFLQWIRFSLAYQIKEFSPEVINAQWSDQTHKILEKAWLKHFSLEDPIAIGSMGKLGSNELNLSSDIDLIFFAKDPKLQLSLREFIKDCSAPHGIPTGYIIDLDLRPEGKSSPLLISPDRLGNHLWNNSDPWERYSYTRLDIKIGNQKLKKETLEVRDKFCYRKYLTSDFFPKFLKLRPKYHESIHHIDNHLKLSAGGIRDLELLIQTFQILHGGRNPELQSLSTADAIRKLIKDSPFSSSAYFKNLLLAYLVLRNAEGGLHAFNEKGDFEYDKDHPYGDLIKKAMFTVRSSIDEYANHWNAQFKHNKAKVRPDYLLQELKEYSSTNGYSTEVAVENFNNFFKEKSFSPYIPAISNQLKLKSIFFDLLCISPYGCQILARRPSLLDIFILRIEDVKAKNLTDLTLHLSDLKMVQHILASLYFSKNKDLDQLNNNITSSYENIIMKIFDHLDCKDKVDLLFLGKAAGSELGLKSDLDFIIINKTEENLSLLCRDIFRALSTTTPFGPLVPFDNRGGPQGQASPLAVKRDSLLEFLKLEAKPWQQLMYLKNRLFFDNSSLTFSQNILSNTDQKELDLILKKRLDVKDPGSVYFKTERGGLFHTEFTLANLYLKLSKAPASPKLKDWSLELSELAPKSSENIALVYENFIKLRTIEQEWCVSGYKNRLSSDISTEKVQILLKQSSDLLDSIHNNYLG